MDEKQISRKSRFLSLVLRHKPEDADIVLDKNGWAPVKDILKNLELTQEELDSVVENNDKKRFEYDELKTKIRARQGHSLKVDVELKEIIPDKKLFHGTAAKFKDSILVEGIKKQTRQHVHLSSELQTAIKVGSRHGSPCVFKVDAPKMVEDGFKFYISNNEVYLTDYVPPIYITVTYLKH